MHDELNLSPFERAIVGCRGIVLRRNHDHVKEAASAIRRREHPAWSSMTDSFRVAA